MDLPVFVNHEPRDEYAVQVRELLAAYKVSGNYLDNVQCYNTAILACNWHFLDLLHGGFAAFLLEQGKNDDHVFTGYVDPVALLNEMCRDVARFTSRYDPNYFPMDEPEDEPQQFAAGLREILARHGVDERYCTLADGFFTAIQIVGWHGDDLSHGNTFAAFLMDETQRRQNYSEDCHREALDRVKPLVQELKMFRRKWAPNADEE